MTVEGEQYPVQRGPSHQMSIMNKRLQLAYLVLFESQNEIM